MTIRAALSTNKNGFFTGNNPNTSRATIKKEKMESMHIYKLGNKLKKTSKPHRSSYWTTAGVDSELSITFKAKCANKPYLNMREFPAKMFSRVKLASNIKIKFIIMK